MLYFTYPLVLDRIGGVTHELVDAVNVHLGVDLLQDLVPLFQAKHDILFDQSELNGGHLCNIGGKTIERLFSGSVAQSVTRTHQVLQDLELPISLLK